MVGLSPDAFAWESSEAQLAVAFEQNVRAALAQETAADRIQVAEIRRGETVAYALLNLLPTTSTLGGREAMTPERLAQKLHAQVTTEGRCVSHPFSPICHTHTPVSR
jgi:hypothetical protein